MSACLQDTGAPRRRPSGGLPIAKRNRSRLDDAEEEFNKALLEEVLKYNTPQITNVVGSYPANPECMGLYDPWNINWYTDTSVRAVAGLDHNVRKCGYAVTCVWGEPSPNYKRLSWWDVLYAIEESPKPCVLILEQKFPDSYKNKVGLVGGNMATHMKALGCVGVISNGPQRDVDEIRDMGDFACIASGLSPGHGEQTVWAVNVPVSVACMDVAPGELVHFDEHGAMKFPANRLPEVVRLCEELQEKEDACLAAVRKCKTADEVKNTVLGTGGVTYGKK